MLGREAEAEKLVVLCGSVEWSVSVAKLSEVSCFRFLVAGWKSKWAGWVASWVLFMLSARTCGSLKSLGVAGVRVSASPKPNGPLSKVSCGCTGVVSGRASGVVGFCTVVSS